LDIQGRALVIDCGGAIAELIDELIREHLSV